MGQEGLDVFPGGGVPGHLAVGVAGLVDGPAVLVAVRVGDRVPLVRSLPDVVSGGGQGLDTRSPCRPFVGVLRLAVRGGGGVGRGGHGRYSFLYGCLTANAGAGA